MTAFPSNPDKELIRITKFEMTLCLQKSKYKMTITLVIPNARKNSIIVQLCAQKVDSIHLNRKVPTS